MKITRKWHVQFDKDTSKTADWPDIQLRYRSMFIRPDKVNIDFIYTSDGELRGGGASAAGCRVLKGGDTSDQRHSTDWWESDLKPDWIAELAEQARLQVEHEISVINRHARNSA